MFISYLVLIIFISEGHKSRVLTEYYGLPVFSAINICSVFLTFYRILTENAFDLHNKYQKVLIIHNKILFLIWQSIELNCRWEIKWASFVVRTVYRPLDLNCLCFHLGHKLFLQPQYWCAMRMMINCCIGYFRLHADAFLSCPPHSSFHIYISSCRIGS